MVKSALTLFITILIGCQPLQKHEKVNEAGQVSEVYYTDKDDLRQGEYQLLSLTNQQIIEKASYRDGKLVGPRIIYYENGNIEIEEHYDNGLLTDTTKVHYTSGKIKLKVPYINGSIQGISQKYYPNGQLMETVTFVDNEENGKFIEYYANGQMHWTGTYLNGPNEYGTLIQYDSTGTHIKTMLCDSTAICKTVFTIQK